MIRSSKLELEKRLNMMNMLQRTQKTLEAVLKDIDPSPGRPGCQLPFAAISSIYKFGLIIKPLGGSPITAPKAIIKLFQGLPA